MPSRVMVEEGLKCSFFSVCDMEDVLLAATEIRQSQLIDAYVNTNSVTRYQSDTNNEQHFHPSSLTFDLLCLFDTGFVEVSHLGLQRKVLFELEARGMTELVAPEKLYQLCMIAQLTEEPIGEMTNTTAPENMRQNQRSTLLTVALKHHMVNFISDCVEHWLDGKYSEAGCTSKFLLDWAWKNVANIKQEVDTASTNFFIKLLQCWLGIFSF